MKLSVKNLVNAGKATTPKPKATTATMTAYKKHGLLIASALLLAVTATADDAGAPDGLRGAPRRDAPAPQGPGLVPGDALAPDGAAAEEGPPAPLRLQGLPDGPGSTRFAGQLLLGENAPRRWTPRGPPRPRGAPSLPAAAKDAPAASGPIVRPGRRALDELAPYNIDMINVPADVTWGDRHVNICLVGTGYDPDHWNDLPSPPTAVTGESFVHGSNWHTDEDGQGTHIAGIIGAFGNGNKGVRGILTDPSTYVFHVVKVPPTLNSQEAVGAIETCNRGYCYDCDVDIISFSSGVPVDDDYLKDAFQNAYDAGALIIAPAGDAYAGVYPTVMSVASVGPNRSLSDCTNAHARSLSDCTNAHAQVEISAPGLDVLSTCSRHDEECKGVSGPCYCTKTGTEYAAAHVVGVAALLKSVFLHRTNNEIRNAMLRSTSEPDDVSGLRNADDWDEYYGWGIVDTANAVARLEQEEYEEQARPRGGRWQGRYECGRSGEDQCHADNANFAPCCGEASCAVFSDDGAGWCECIPKGEVCNMGLGHGNDATCCDGYQCVEPNGKGGAMVCQEQA